MASAWFWWAQTPYLFVRIRHYGLLGNRCRHAKNAQCRALFAQPAPEPREPESAAALMLRLTGLDIHQCPVFRQGRLRVFTVLAPMRFAPPLPKATGPPL